MTEFPGTAILAWETLRMLPSGLLPPPLWPGGPGTWAQPSLPPVAPPALTIPHGSTAAALVAVISSPLAFPGEVTFTGNLTAGSNQITNASTTTGLAVGQAIAPSALQGGMQNGAIITGIAGTTVTTSGVAFLTSTGVAFTTSDWTPFGTLGFSVSPGTGVTVFDWNMDGTVNTVQGNGTLFSNYAGQGVGEVFFTFASAGSFTVSGSYTSSDPLYSSVSAPSLAVTAT
jgi:hypothetical protein